MTSTGHGAHWTKSMEAKYKGKSAVYFISSHPFTKGGAIKIGFSRNLPNRMGSFKTCYQGDVFIHGVAFYKRSQTDTETSNVAELQLHKYLESGGVQGVTRLPSRRPVKGGKKTEFFTFPTNRELYVAIKYLSLQSPLPKSVLYFPNETSRGRTIYPTAVAAPRGVLSFVDSDGLRIPGGGTRAQHLQRRRDSAARMEQEYKIRRNALLNRANIKRKGKTLRSDSRARGRR